MADYTSAEIQAAVEKIVRSSIRRPYGTLGNRDARTTFNDLQDAAAGVFILKPNAPFYVVYLGTQRLLGLLEAQQEILLSLIEAIDNTNRRVSEIDNLAPLNNARAALDALSNAAGSRNNLFTSIESVPAYQRYEQNVQRFLDESSKNSRAKGQVVPTPQESRAMLAGLVRQLAVQQAELLARANYLVSAIDDYDSLQLPALVASSVVSRARNVLEERITELEALTPKERLSRIRAVTLDLLAGRAAVKGLGSLRGTTVFAILEGTGAVFADADHPAIPASLAAKVGPYPVWSTSNQLDLVLDGSFSCQVLVPGSFLARADSTLAEPYPITAGENNTLILDEIGPGSTVRTTVTLTAGAARTAAQVVANINAALPLSTSLVAESVFQTTRFVGVVDLDATGSPNDADFVLPAPGTWEALGTRVGDFVQVTESPSPNNGSVFQVVTIAGDTISTTQVSGPAPVDELLMAIEVGASRTVRIRIKTGSELAALTGRIGFSFPNIITNSAILGTPTVRPQCLGFIAGSTVRSRATTAAQVAQDVPRFATTQQGGTAKLDASTELVPSLWLGQGRSDPDNIRKLIAFKLRARADVPAGTVIVFPIEGALDAGVVVGDYIVIRETAVPADMNVPGIVGAVTNTSITATMGQTISGGTDLQLEVGPNFIISSEYLDLEITDSLSQNGKYTLDFEGQNPEIPFELTIEGQVPFNRGLGGQPAFFTLALGHERVVFKSTDTSLNTEVRVVAGGPSSAAARFFDSLPAQAQGTAAFFSIPSNPGSLQEGDILEITETTYNQVDYATQLVALELSDLLIELDPPLPTDFGSIAMSQVSQPPFARIRLGKKNNYVVFEERLRAWLALPQNQPAWFTELNRLLNPLIVNENPTIAAVNSAKQHAQIALSSLTRIGAISTNSDPDESLEAILASYTVSTVEEIDTLVETYLERGALRGVDLLLMGRFNEFFGTSLESMSYDGAAREALRDVQRLDLPIRKTGRAQNHDQSVTTAEWEDPDYDFDQSDTEGIEDIEIPGDFAEITPPGR